MSELAARLVAVDEALGAAGIPHAFGGAIALAYCTDEPRGTRDLDVNVFVKAERAREVFQALPPDVRTSPADVAAAERDDQVRVWWDDTPIDLFFDAGAFHEQAAENVRWVPFQDRTIPILSCEDLVVFKTLFNRTRDWADIEAVIEARAVDCSACVEWIAHLLGADSPVAKRLSDLCG